MRLLQILFIALYFFIDSSVASSLCLNQIVGINLAGAEYGSSKLAAISGEDYFFPTELQLAYYRDRGFNSIRLPLAWEHLQSSLYGPINEQYASEIRQTLISAQKFKLKVVLDLHNYDKYRGSLVGTEQVPYKAFEFLWAKIANNFKGYPALLAYGLMNEPHHTGKTWHVAAQYGVDGIRSQDMNHQIYIGGDEWSGTSSWDKNNPRPFVKDLSNQVVYEGHIYLDDDYSGKYSSSVGSVDMMQRIDDRLTPFLNWLNFYKQKGVIGEWGMPANSQDWLPTIKIFVNMLERKCLDSFVWAGGKWSPSYILSLEPSEGNDKLLIEVIKKWRKN